MISSTENKAERAASQVQRRAGPRHGAGRRPLAQLRIGEGENLTRPLTNSHAVAGDQNLDLLKHHADEVEL